MAVLFFGDKDVEGACGEDLTFFSSRRNIATLCPKQVMGVKVVWEMLGPCLLATNGVDHSIGFPHGSAVLASHFGIDVIDTNPPVPF
jgi:hypothetical protein